VLTSDEVKEIVERVAKKYPQAQLAFYPQTNTHFAYIYQEYKDFDNTFIVNFNKSKEEFERLLDNDMAEMCGELNE